MEVTKRPPAARTLRSQEEAPPADEEADVRASVGKDEEGEPGPDVGDGGESPSGMRGAPGETSGTSERAAEMDKAELSQKMRKARTLYGQQAEGALAKHRDKEGYIKARGPPAACTGDAALCMCIIASEQSPPARARLPLAPRAGSSVGMLRRGHGPPARPPQFSAVPNVIKELGIKTQEFWEPHAAAVASREGLLSSTEFFQVLGCLMPSPQPLPGVMVRRAGQNSAPATLAYLVSSEQPLGTDCDPRVAPALPFWHYLPSLPLAEHA